MIDRKTLLSDKALISALGAHVRTRVPAADADDVVQSVLADALASEGAPEDAEALRKWLFGVARNKIADFYRRNRREQPSDGVEDKESPTSGRAPAKDLLEWAEGELPPGSDAKRTFEWMLREGDGEKLESIAEAEKVPAPRVRKRVSRMREHFRARWAAYVAGLAAAGIALVIVFYMLRKKPEPEVHIVPEPKPVPTESMAAPPKLVPSTVPSASPSTIPSTIPSTSSEHERDSYDGPAADHGAHDDGAASTTPDEHDAEQSGLRFDVTLDSSPCSTFPPPIPMPTNEPVLSYAPGSPERTTLKAALATMAGERADVPHVVGGKELRDGAKLSTCGRRTITRSCSRRATTAARPSTEKAIAAALAAAPAWAATSFEERARVFLRAAELLAGPWRADAQRRDDARPEQDRVPGGDRRGLRAHRFPPLQRRVRVAPRRAADLAAGVLNTLELRPLEGFVLAVTPFNFTAIAGNLPTALRADGQRRRVEAGREPGLAAYHTMRLFEAAGLPPGVINVVYGDGAKVAEACLRASRRSPASTSPARREVFQSIWRGVGENIASYKSYPRLVGETGGKDFVFAHPSRRARRARRRARARRVRVPGPEVLGGVARVHPASRSGRRCATRMRRRTSRAIKMGDVTRLPELHGRRHQRARVDAPHGVARSRSRATPACKMLDRRRLVAREGLVRGADARRGRTTRRTPIIAEELFGPVLAVHVYDDASRARRRDARARRRTSPYGLTGAVFARDRAAIAHAVTRLRQAAGNLYINDKPTGAVVGQQPFGGARASGTNDKAGSAYNLLRWASPRVVKETFVPADERRLSVHARRVTC